MPDRFKNHRRALAEEIGADGIAVIPAASETMRNNDVEHVFRQDSDFFYLTGFDEPDAIAVIAPGSPDGDYVLFVRPRDRDSEIWTGYRAGTEGAIDRYQADKAFELSDFVKRMTELMAGRETLWYRSGNKEHDDALTSLVAISRRIRERTGKSAPTTVSDVGFVLAEHRLRKSKPEIESLRAACVLSAEGHREAMRFTRPGMHEYQVQAAMEFIWREGGSPRNGYGSIVASGANSCILHYVENDGMIEDGDLVLIDAAPEVDYFSSDITRTFPANGKFTAPQRAIYDMVLTAHRAALAKCFPGSDLKSIHEATAEVVAAGLVDLGLVPKGLEETLAMHHYREFFMHATSHWLGIDVHDVGSTRVDGKPRPLEAGMSFTIEPGVYIGPDRPEVEFALYEYDMDDWGEAMATHPAVAAESHKKAVAAAEKVTVAVPSELLGIGVRIEDDILITDDGHENLSAGVPVEADQVEELCAEESWLVRG